MKSAFLRGELDYRLRGMAVPMLRFGFTTG